MRDCTRPGTLLSAPLCPSVPLAEPLSPLPLDSDTLLGGGDTGAAPNSGAKAQADPPVIKQTSAPSGVTGAGAVGPPCVGPLVGSNCRFGSDCASWPVRLPTENEVVDPPRRVANRIAEGRFHPVDEGAGSIPDLTQQSAFFRSIRRMISRVVQRFILRGQRPSLRVLPCEPCRYSSQQRRKAGQRRLLPRTQLCPRRIDRLDEVRRERRTSRSADGPISSTRGNLCLQWPANLDTTRLCGRSSPRRGSVGEIFCLDAVLRPSEASAKEVKERWRVSADGPIVSARRG
ncbi:hypothetical protein SAMN06295900_104436 [Trinickia caryophylli]|uniref:Uncharacterized protein n=1 Tax=Trinickia caryophylli TaxID=28094 RepID=A0A1X7E3M9_TRICW|nr:hypothetical protein SAMN06295900_104436 [Trinickia caryophylli]